MRYQTKELQLVPPSFPKEEQEEPHTPGIRFRHGSTIIMYACLYDEQGKLLDTLQLDLIIEEYIERVTESQKQNHLSSPEDDDDEDDRERTGVTGDDTTTGYRCSICCDTASYLPTEV